MKKQIILIITLLQFSLVFSQNEYFNKHNYVLDIGVSNNNLFKNIYMPKYNSCYFNEEWKCATMYPGSYLHPVYSPHFGVLYQYFEKKGFQVNLGLHYTNRTWLETRSKDSVNVYYLYPDSIKNKLPYYLASAPLYEKDSNHNIELLLFVGYQYKRFSITAGTIINLINIHKRDMNFINNQTAKFTEVLYFLENEDLILYQVNFKYLLIKNKLPTTIYIGFEYFMKLGLEFNISAINFK